MMLCLRLLAGFTSFISKRAWSHSFSIGPEGSRESSCMAISPTPASTATGIEMLPAAIRIATSAANRFSTGV